LANFLARKEEKARKKATDDITSQSRSLFACFGAKKS
jgi:hypothetical protein